MTTIQDLRDESLRFRTSRYRIFDNLTPISNREATVNPNNQWVMTHALCYEIVWPQDTFNQLLTDTSLFIYPQEAFSAEPFIFVLYLVLRATVRTFDVTGSIEALRSRVGFARANDRTFETVLRSNIKRQQKNPVDGFIVASNVNKKLEMHLWGYTLIFDFKSMSYKSSVNAGQVNQWCNINDKTQTAPTVFNELASDISLIRSMETIAKTKNYGLTELSWFKNRKKIGSHTLLFCSGDHNYALTKYHNNDELFEMATLICSRDNSLTHTYVLSTLVEFQSELKFIKYRDGGSECKIIRDVYYYILNKIDGTESLSLDYVVGRLARCTSLLPLVKDYETRKVMTEELQVKLNQYF